ncbi:hypothetical protein B8W92_05805 [Moraxella osloensis]|nr:hypothetical protein [Moraxella osloensis]PAL16202.1 hypothetical protein B8W92_05805 [Moraxella osloensis]
MTMKDLRIYMRLGHRYVGFFMVGIMLVYSLSGMLLVFRDTDFLKSSKTVKQVVASNLDEKNLAKTLKMKNIDFREQQGDIQLFKDGQYNVKTGEVTYTSKKLPVVLDKMVNFHKAPSKGSMGGLNVLFGLSLLFFVVSSFFLFAPSSKIFKRGLAFVAVGVVLSVILLML